MDKPDDPGVLALRFPLWLLATPDGKRLPQVTGTCGEKATPFFTDKRPAERFRGEHPQFSRHVLVLVETMTVFAETLLTFEKSGFTHVTFDQSDRAKMFFAIADLRARIEDP